MRLIVEACATGVGLVDLGRRLQQSPDAIRKARQRGVCRNHRQVVGRSYAQKTVQDNRCLRPFAGRNINPR